MYIHFNEPRPQATARPRNRQLRLETLEDRAVPANLTFIVNTTDDLDDGVCDTQHCSLREAINAANAAPGHDAIYFRIPGPGPHTISPDSALPTVTDPVFINGFAQPYAKPNTLPISQGSNADLRVILSGQDIQDGSSGLVINGGGSTVRGLVINGFGYPDLDAPGSPSQVPAGGLVITGKGGNRIEGNFIGTDVSGTQAVPNNFYGIFVASSDNTIGGTTTMARNLISGNQGFGIQITASDQPGKPGHTPAEHNQIQGNLVGTDRTGQLAVGNSGGGVMIQTFARHNLIGGWSDAERNVISGNTEVPWTLSTPGFPQDYPDAPYPVSGGHGSGVHVDNLSLIGSEVPVPNIVAGNYIGTTASGDAALPNYRGVGGIFTNSLWVEGNVISGNTMEGVAIASTYNRDIVVLGNQIGTDATGQQAVGNGWAGVDIVYAQDNVVVLNTVAHNHTGVMVRDHIHDPNAANGNLIRGNSIHSNDNLGIDLWAYPAGLGHTPNDYATQDADVGPNGLQNAPEPSLAIAGANTQVWGVLVSKPNTQYIIDFYANPAPDPSGCGEGERWLGATMVQTDPFGNVFFSAQNLGPSSAGEWVSMTATELSTWNTSEFSSALELQPGRRDVPKKVDVPVDGPAREGIEIYFLPEEVLQQQRSVRISDAELRYVDSAGYLKALEASVDQGTNWRILEAKGHDIAQPRSGQVLESTDWLSESAEAIPINRWWV